MLRSYIKNTLLTQKIYYSNPWPTAELTYGNSTCKYMNIWCPLSPTHVSTRNWLKGQAYHSLSDRFRIWWGYIPGVGNFRVHPRFHPDDVGWNLGSIQIFSTPDIPCLFGILNYTISMKSTKIPGNSTQANKSEEWIGNRFPNRFECKMQHKLETATPCAQLIAVILIYMYLEIFVHGE